MTRHKTSSRLLAMLLSLILVMGILPTTAFAQNSWGGTGVAEVQKLGGDLYAEGNNLVVKNGSDGDLTQIYYANTNGVTVGNPINLSEISSDITGDTTGGFDLKNVGLSATHNGTFNNDTGAFANLDVVIWMEGGTLADISAGNINAQCESFTVHMSGGTLTSVVTAFNSAIAAHTIYISGGRIEKNQAAQDPLYLSGSPSIGGEGCGVTVKSGEKFYLNGALNGADVYVVPQDDFTDGTVIAEGSGYQITENDVSQLHLTGDYAEGKELYLDGNSVKIRTRQVTAYNVWVGNTKVTEENASDVLGNNTVSYDADTNTLTLNGLNLSDQGHEVAIQSDTVFASVFSQGDLNIVLAEGSTNTISTTGAVGNAQVLGVAAMTADGNAGKVSVSGNGSLSVTQTLSSTTYYVAGILGGEVSVTDASLNFSVSDSGYTMGIGADKLDIQSADITCSGTAFGLTGTSSLSVSGDSHIKATGSRNALYSDMGTISVDTGLTILGSTQENDFENLSAAQVSSDGKNIVVGTETAKTVEITGIPAVSYLDENGDEQTLMDAYTTVTSSATTWNNGWYVVDGSVTIGSRVTVTGNVKLILKDGANLTVKGGISVPSGSTFTVYGQQNGTGNLTSNGTNGTAGIGGTADNVNFGTIVLAAKGKITATGDIRAAGIGGGKMNNKQPVNGTIHIYCGTIEATGGNWAAGIGGGADSVTNCEIIIDGGTITAQGGENNVGIGGTDGSKTIKINGGDIKAYGSGAGAGIGGSYNASGGSITITGGFVEAGSIGGGSAENGGPGGTIIISGGIVTADRIGAGGDNQEGSFSTTSQGNAVIFAGSITDQSGKNANAWRGLIFEGNDGKIYGESYAVEEAITIPEGKTLTVEDGKTLINSDGKITNNGTIYVELGGTYNGLETSPKPVEYQKEQILYLEYENGGFTNKYIEEFTPISKDNRPTTWTTGWYVVDGTVEIDSRVTVTGDVKLILKDGANLTVNGGIDVSGTSNSFTIYAQSTEESKMGGLTATAADKTGNAGIGSSGRQTAGAITVNGGRVTATGGSRSEQKESVIPGEYEEIVYTGAGIGGGEKSACSMITINGGIVTANPGQGSDFWETSNSAAIGNGGQNRGDRDYDVTTVGTIVINGGSVNATGVFWGAGIGGGDEMPIASITINGGIVNAEGDDSAGIGNGGAGDGGTITITGGTINAVSESACGIGGGYISDIEKVVITGGDITATSDRGAGIGSCAYQTTAQVTISGGIVTATSNKGDGIGMGDIFRNDLVDFSTGTNGDAVIFASSIADQTGKDSWNGLIFVDNNGKIYGDSYTVEDGLTIPSDKILTIENGKTMIIPDGVTFDFAGEIRLDEGGQYTGTLPSGAKVTYQIQWDTDGDGTVDDTTYVAYGAIPAHADGSKESDPQYTYTFTGWSPELAVVTGTAKYTAMFDSSLNQYTVTLPSGKGYTVTASGSTTVNYDTEFTFTVTVENGYSKTDGFAVKANGTKLTEQSGGSYKVTVKSNTDITVEGVEDTTPPSNLTVSYETNGFKEFLNTITFGLFFKDTVTVTITATDEGSGVKEISYQLGDGDLQTVETQNSKITFTVEPEFKGNIQNVTATDNAGNTSEGIDYEYFAVEKNKPADVTVDTNGYVSGKWTNDDVTITVSGSTATSGIAKYQYSTDGGQSWHDMTATEKTDATATDPLNVTKAQITISGSGTADYIFRAVSNAGNESAFSAPVTVKTDKVQPTIAAIGNTDYYLTGDTITITADAGGSGITKVEVQAGNDSWTDITDSYLSGYTVTANGTYTFRVTNGAGVTASTSITYDNLDSVKPVVSIDSDEYISGNWINKNVTLSVSNTAANLGTTTFQYKVGDGNWQTCNGAITVSEETDGTVYTFKAISASGVESDEVSITVKIDKTAPEGDITIEQNSVKKFIHDITFGLFFNKNVDVTITGTDNLSGVAAVEYYRSEEILTEDEVSAIEDWTVYSSISETAEDTEQFIYYVKITDEAGNTTCFGSDGATFDLTAPVIAGVTEGATYYTTQSVTVSDTNLQSVTLNDESVGETFTLAGNTEAVYTIAATDKAGNKTTATVTMKPISSLEESIGSLTPDNVTSEDMGKVETVKEQIESIDLEDATDDEKAALQEILDKCDDLVEKIEESAQAGSTENTDKVEDITADNVKPEDKDDLTAAKEDLENALENFGDNYTEEEKAEIQNKLDQIDDALESLEKVETVEDAISKLPDTVEPDDTDAEQLIQEAKEQYNALTEHEKSLVSEDTREKLESLLAALGDYEVVKGNGSKWEKGADTGLVFTANGAYSKFTGIEVDGKAVDKDNYTAVSGSTVITLKPEYLETLSVGAHTLTVQYTDGEASCEFTIVKKPAEGTDNDTQTPETGDNNNMALWITLMFIAACGLTGVMAYGRKKKYGK